MPGWKESRGLASLVGAWLVRVCGRVWAGRVDSQTRPLFGYDDAVLRAPLLIANRTRETGPNLGRSRRLADDGDVLRAFVFHATSNVAVEEEGDGAAVVVIELAHIQQHAIDDAAILSEKIAARPLGFFRGGAMTPEHPDGTPGHRRDQSRAGDSFPYSRVEETHFLGAGLHPGGFQN